MIDPELRGRTVLVTGANSGIGAAIALAFAAQGADVAVHYLDLQIAPEDGSVRYEHAAPGHAQAEAILDQIRSWGGRAEAVPADLSDPDGPRALLEGVEAALGSVDIVVNNAAHCESPDTIFAMTAGTLDRHFDVNTRAPVLLIAELARRIRASGRNWGRVINVSTDSAQVFPGQIAYGASKAALEAFTRSLAIELGPLGITVNTVAPGPIQTGWISSELEQQILPNIPLGRVGRPEEIADAVVFLASEQAAWITGQVIQVSGGHAL